MIIAEEQLCRASTEYAKSALDFYCSAPAHADVWTAVGTWAGVIVAAIVGLYARKAWITAQAQLKDVQTTRRREEVRKATHDFIRAIHDLRRYAFIPEANIDLYRSAAGQELILFRIVIGDGLDRDKLYMLTDTAIKAAGVTHSASHPRVWHAPKPRIDVIHLTVNPIIEGLERFERGILPAAELANYIDTKMRENLNHPTYYGDQEIRSALKQSKFLQT